MRSLLREIPSYFGASAIALCVDVGTLAALTKIAGWHYFAAAAISFTAGGVVLYLISVRFVFGFRRVERGVLELPLFILLGVIGLGVNLAVMRLGVEYAHAGLLVAKGAAASCSFVVNFALRRALLFAPAAIVSNGRIAE
jgi:putative flippase GtrA